ncbi:MAG: hypothetical protein ABFR95_11110 [Actinomycetota bacterium]
MTDRAGAVYDLGYEPFEGERTGRSGARKTVFFDGVRRVLGLRRKARRKIMPWALLLIATLPVVAVVGVAFLVPVAVEEGLNLGEQNSDFFVLAGTITMLFTALAAPELLIPDRKDGVLSMLSSRPLTAIDYLGTRFASLAAVVGGFMIIPQLLLFLGEAGTGPDGLFRGIVDSADKLPKILAVAGVYVIALVPLGFVIASLSNRKSIATASYLAVTLALSAVSNAMVFGSTITGGRWAALFAPIDTAHAVNAWIFGASGEPSLLDAADIHPVVGLGALAVFGLALSAFAVHRYRKLL